MIGRRYCRFESKEPTTRFQLRRLLDRLNMIPKLVKHQHHQYLSRFPSACYLLKMATKGNLGEVVTTCMRSWVQASSWGFPSGAKKVWGLSPKAKIRVLHTAQLDITIWTLKRKAELNKKAHSAMILCLGNKILKEVTGEMTAAEEIKERSKEKVDDGEGLYVRGRTDRRIHVSQGEVNNKDSRVLFGDKRECKIRGKSHRVSFGVTRHTTQGVIDYVHSDLWGLSHVESLGGKMYFLFITDDYSWRVWVYILRFKHEAFGKFKEWKQLVENQTGRMVKKIRTDNRLEFCNREFKQLCIRVGLLDI
nr:retrovirus-related Pol polyprotein from transposon TNT 1-94 [Tanacetum cinerariifolium]